MKSVNTCHLQYIAEHIGAGAGAGAAGIGCWHDRRTNAPTEQPAANEGTEPARKYPVMPPPAVRRARI